MIEITNNGPLILSTNYWQSDYANNGYAFISPNAGAIRLLLPPNLSADIVSMRAAKNVVISIGKHDEYLRDISEILFDDGTDYPYVQFIDLQQWQHLPSQKDYDKPACELTAWEDRRRVPHKVLTKQCFLRRSNQLPDLSPWE